MINLYEYQNKVSYTDTDYALESFLDEIWNNRESVTHWNAEDDVRRSQTQRYIQFFHKTNEIKSNKYVGVIHCNGKTINLLPKIFYTPDTIHNDTNLQAMQCHILWWLSYSNRIKLPKYATSLHSLKGSFFEILIYLFAKYTSELLSTSIYQHYESTEDELTYIKGRINTSQYIRENVARGRWHKINCSYELFTFDTLFNKIIKYVATLLYNQSENAENKTMLRTILFILDDVELQRVTVEDCNRIRFNQMFSEFEMVLDYCKLFLQNSISFNYKNDLKLFAFLVPMEKLFEEFVCGFIKKHIPEVSVKAQTTSVFLAENNIFNLRPDLVITADSHTMIVDTKYKIVYSDVNDPQKGVSQNDLYQMAAYAIRFKCTSIILLYPSTIQCTKNLADSIIIRDELAHGKLITVSLHQLPIINHELLANENILKQKVRLEDLFDNTTNNLKNILSKIFSDVLFDITLSDI